MSALMKRFEAHNRQAETQQAEQWRDFARDFVNSEPDEIDVPETLDRLAELGRTFEELRKLADLVARRKELAGPAADLEATSKAAASANAAVNAEHERFERVQQEHRQKLYDLQRIAGNAQDAKETASKARRELIQGCRQEIRDGLAGIAGMMVPLTSQADHYRQTIKSNEKRLDEYGELKPDAAGLIERAQQALSKIDPQIAELRAQQRELERQAMEPLSIDIE